MKKTAMKAACMCLAALMACAALTSCGTPAPEVSDTVLSQAPSGKVVVNIEGTVTAVNGNEITLDSGKVIVLSENTVFAGDPSTGNQVSDQIAVGHYIQGYTADGVNVSRIHTNRAPQRSSGKIAIHFEGTVTAIDGDRITLDNGKVILVTADTVYTDANGTVENAALSVGDYIQGSTADDPAAAEVTAKRIHIAF